MNDKGFLRLAIDEAKKATDENKFGSVIVKDWKIVSCEPMCLAPFRPII